MVGCRRLQRKARSHTIIQTADDGTASERLRVGYGFVPGRLPSFVPLESPHFMPSHRPDFLHSWTSLRVS